MYMCLGERCRGWATLVLAVSISSFAGPRATAQAPKDGASIGKTAPEPTKADTTRPAGVKLGLVINQPKAYQGYTLLAPQNSKDTYLIDMQGKVVKKWEANCTPALSAYLLENGHLLRPGSLGGEERSFGGGPGAGGRVQEYSWDGELVWDFKLFNEKQLPHHDVTRLPNGNVLMIVWDKKNAQQALAAGRRPELTGDSHLLPDSLVEVKPTGKTTGQVVWEWRLWDHLVQDFDKSKPNYGNIAEHPELVDVNYGEDVVGPIAATKGGADKLKSIGYVGATTTPNRPQRVNPDWTHANGVAYNPELDQIVISIHNFSEFWIIDHSTTTAEAASHTGGRSGKGGDLLYRWGNPLVYHAGTKADQRLYAQHNAHWITHGLPGEGHLLVFNNGMGRPDGSYSSVDEIVLPVDPQGRYYRPATGAYGPEAAVWSYTAPKKSDFQSMLISGSQRLPNGDTLICSGINGTVFEVTPDKEMVWKYVNPVKNTGGPGGFGPPSTPGQILPVFMSDRLNLSTDQKKQIQELQKEADSKLNKLLSEVQKKQFKQRPQGFGPGGFGGGPMIQPGQIMSAGDQERLKLSPEQKRQLEEFQKDLDGRLDKIFKDDQKKQLKDMRNFTFGAPAGPGGGRGGPAGPGGFNMMISSSPPAPPGRLLSSFVQENLKMTDEQKKQINDFQKEADARLEKILTEEQRKQFQSPPEGGARGGVASASGPGTIIPLTVQVRLKLTSDQRKLVQALQKEADGLLDKLLGPEQKKQFRDLRANVGRGGPGGPPGGFGRGGPGGFGFGGPGGGPGFGGPPGGSSLFRAYRYGPDYAGLAGKKLVAGMSVEDMQLKGPTAGTPR